MNAWKGWSNYAHAYNNVIGGFGHKGACEKVSYLILILS